MTASTRHTWDTAGDGVASVSFTPGTRRALLETAVAAVPGGLGLPLSSRRSTHPETLPGTTPSGVRGGPFAFRGVCGCPDRSCSAADRAPLSGNTRRSRAPERAPSGPLDQPGEVRGETHSPDRSRRDARKRRSPRSRGSPSLRREVCRWLLLAL